MPTMTTVPARREKPRPSSIAGGVPDVTNVKSVPRPAVKLRTASRASTRLELMTSVAPNGRAARSFESVTSIRDDWVRTGQGGALDAVEANPAGADDGHAGARRNLSGVLHCTDAGCHCTRQQAGALQRDAGRDRHDLRAMHCDAFGETSNVQSCLTGPPLGSRSGLCSSIANVPSHCVISLHAVEAVTGGR